MRDIEFTSQFKKDYKRVKKDSNNKDLATISDLSWTSGKFAFNGIINATLLTVVGYQVFSRIAKARKN